MNNYKLLPALISLLQTRNLTESAKALHVTQSAMSKTLSQIRLAFHDNILIREANQFVLTRRGEELKQQLPLLLQQLDELYRPAVMDFAQCQRNFSLASSDYVAQFILPGIFKTLASQAPNASVEYQLWQKDWLSQLSQRPLDLVSTITETIPENLYGKKMAEDSLVMLMSRSYAGKNKLTTLDNYVAARHIIITGGGDKDSPVDLALLALGKQRKIYAKVPFFQSAIELLLTTDTVLTIPLHIAADFVALYDLQLAALPFESKAHQYYLLWHARYHQDPEHKWFRELCYPLLKNHLLKTKAQGMKLLHGN
ncbi:LysR family transcriptional regulator [Thalassomonas actiniarum]|uniref:LysR family transcriptional regulator n=1 Tax=Thalassomonas actiniarum TaxID=485447 RepID=A0AAF0C4S1_9GAMM|nr:LysR family transcriptional regulator [Thalassomonas actiniarum]WDE00284.1 LysR family transcriptional regulator [Thalassomonas actiniarum]